MKTTQLQIPISFYQYAQHITVEWCQDLAQTQGAVGEELKWTNRIRLQPDCPSYHRDKEAMEQAFFHEYVHKMFDFAGREDLSADERLVDICGHLIHEMLATAEYGVKNGNR